jgi:hypothetical protein
VKAVDAIDRSVLSRDVGLSISLKQKVKIVVLIRIKLIDEKNR